MDTIQKTSNKGVIAAKAAIGASVAYLAILVLLHIIKPEVTPSWQTLSIYSRGDWGWLGQIAYCLLGVTHLVIFAALKGHVKSTYGKVGLALLLIAGIGGIMGGLGVSDPLNTPQADMTSSGQLHAIGAGLEIWGAPFAMLLISLNLLRKNAAWKPERKAILGVIALPLVGWALFMGSGASAGGNVGPGDIIGTMNRVAILAYMIWQIVIARAVLRIKTSE
jgi:hypothetical protein